MFARIPSAAYIEFKAWLLEEQKQSPDGTSVAWRAEVRAELYNPQDLTNQAALPSAIGVMQAWCAAISNACGKTAVKNYLVGGSSASRTRRKRCATRSPAPTGTTMRSPSPFSV